MEQVESQNPIALLQDIERKSRANARGLPQQAELEEEWNGIAFRVSGQRLVAPINQVKEMLPLPMLTRVPGAKSWVMGIANVRGMLLPVMDLAMFLDGRHTQIGKASRVMVINHDSVLAGLLVDEVLGLRHFLNEEQTHELPDVALTVQPYLDHGYRKGEDHWAVFSFDKLADSPLFLQVAV